MISEAAKSRKLGGGGVQEKKLGVVDIGSNTVHLLVASTNGRRIVPLLDASEGLRLGNNLDSSGGSISVEKAQELLTTLVRFRDATTQLGVQDLHLLATHALRMAANRAELCAAITEATGWPVKILNPEQEAALSFLGADADCPSAGPQVVVDIGGGSMQVGIGQNGQLWDSISLQLGASRVANSFLPSDPPTYIEEASLVNYLANIIPPAVPLPDTNVTGVVGVGGTLRRVPKLLGATTGQLFPADALEQLLATLREHAAAEIAARYQLKPDRARLLMPALLLIREVLRGYHYPPLIIGAYGLREGAILALARYGKI